MPTAPPLPCARPRSPAASDLLKASGPARPAQRSVPSSAHDNISSTASPQQPRQRLRNYSFIFSRPGNAVWVPVGGTGSSPPSQQSPRALKREIGLFLIKGSLTINITEPNIM